jgi:imidazolonepropionase-like amidohydrolase
MCIAILLTLSEGELLQIKSQSTALPNFALVNGKWFNGESFTARTVYSVNGRFTFKKPSRVDRNIDLSGTWIVPPFGEAHNHSIGTGVEEREKKAIQKFLADGVFYVKIQGNIPISDDRKRDLLLNRPDGIDVVFAQGSLTASGGHPILLIETVMQSKGCCIGHTKETLKDNRYFTIDSEAELTTKWPAILAKHPDFIKTFLWSSDEFEKRKNDPAYEFQRALDPRLLAKIVEKAHANKLPVSAHVTTSADFHIAVTVGVDEITHLPYVGTTPITVADAKLAARRGIVVITTGSLVLNLPPIVLPKAEMPGAIETQKANLKLLRENGVRVAVGSDNVNDSSAKEFDYLRELGVFDNLTLLKMWCERSPKAIFPDRKIGVLGEGYEASFLALEGNPLEDLRNVHKIKLRFKQGIPLER